MPDDLADVIARMVAVAAAKRGRRLGRHLAGCSRDALQGYLWTAFGEWAEDYAFLLDHAEVILPALQRLLEERCLPH